MRLTLEGGSYGGFWATDDQGRWWTCCTVTVLEPINRFDGIWSPQRTDTFWRAIGGPVRFTPEEQTAT